MGTEALLDLGSLAVHRHERARSGLCLRHPRIPGTPPDSLLQSSISGEVRPALIEAMTTDAPRDSLRATSASAWPTPSGTDSMLLR